MARRRFFVPEVRRGRAELSGADAEHLVRVLRVEAGQIFEVSDNRDVYLAEVETARKAEIVFRLQEKLPAREPGVEITLFAALIKFDHFEWLVEKATELGAAAIVPVESMRTERGLTAASIKRKGRWEKIVLEASQQSRRARLPRFESTVPLTRALEFAAEFRFLLDESAGAEPILAALPETKSRTDRVGLLLGPEGGWTDEERQQAIAAGWTSCSLGPTILRAETAAAAALAVIQAAWDASSAHQGCTGAF